MSSRHKACTSSGSQSFRSSWPRSSRRAIAQPPGGGASGRPRWRFVMKTLNHPFFLDMQRGARRRPNARRRAGGAGGRARDRRREADADRREPDPDRHAGARASRRAARARSSSALVKANRARIPVVVVDTRVDAKAAADGGGVKLETFVGSDNYEGGQLAGEYPRRRSTGGKAQGRHPRGDSRATRPAIRGCAASATRSKARPA